MNERSLIYLSTVKVLEVAVFRSALERAERDTEIKSDRKYKNQKYSAFKSISRLSPISVYLTLSNFLTRINGVAEIVHNNLQPHCLEGIKIGKNNRNRACKEQNTDSLLLRFIQLE